jgi:hypothetical protein
MLTSAFCVCQNTYPSLGKIFYHANSKTNTIQYFLSLYKSGDYYLEVSSFTPGMGISSTLSRGKYVVNDNVITMTDFYHGFEMKMRILNNYIFVEQSFDVFMINKIFIYRTEQHWPYYTPKKLIISDTTEQEHKTYTVKYGIYNGEYCDIDFCNYQLNLKKDKTYELKIYGQSLMKGQWRIENNKILLYSPALDCTFKLIIESSTVLRSEYLPGDTYGIKLNHCKMQ